jgi:guanylate kinase
MPDLFLSVSATTRLPRPGEAQAGAYRFVSEDDFDRMVAQGAFLEWASVFGNRYGTPAAPIEAALSAGRDAVLEIDVQGARSVRAGVADAVLVFLVPPSEEELQRRLLSRGTEEDNELARRLTAAADEMANADWFDHIVVNDELSRAADEVAAIIESCRRLQTPRSERNPS